MDKEKLNWRSYADTQGEDDRGPIADRWNLEGTPTLYVIDHKGIIRKKWLGGPGEKELDALIDALIEEAVR